MNPNFAIRADDSGSPQKTVEIPHSDKLNKEDSVRSAGSTSPPESCLKPGLTIRVPKREGPVLTRTRSETQDLKKSFPVLHCQVARLRKEDQQLTEDVTEVLDAPKERLLLHAGDNFVTTPRPSTPSPLGMRTKSCSADAWDAATLSRTSSSSF